MSVTLRLLAVAVLAWPLACSRKAAPSGRPVSSDGGPAADAGEPKLEAYVNSYGDRPASIKLRGSAPAGTRTTFEGCMGRSGDRSRQSFGVAVSWNGKELEVRHGFQHPCGLNGEAAVELVGSSIRVVGSIGGMPARCPCESELVATVPISPGTYQLEVLHMEEGKTYTELSRWITARPRGPGRPEQLVAPPPQPP